MEGTGKHRSCRLLTLSDDELEKAMELILERPVDRRKSAQSGTGSKLEESIDRQVTVDVLDNMLRTDMAAACRSLENVSSLLGRLDRTFEKGCKDKLSVLLAEAHAALLAVNCLKGDTEEILNKEFKYKEKK